MADISASADATQNSSVDIQGDLPANVSKQLYQLSTQEIAAQKKALEESDAASKQLQGTLESERKSASEIESVQPPKVPTIKPLPPPPDTKENPDEVHKIIWSSVAFGLLGAVIGGGTLFGLAAMDGFLKGAKNKMSAEADRKLQQWGMAYKKTLDENQQAQQQYQDVLQNSQLSFDEKVQKMGVTANILKDEVMLQALRDKRWDIVDRIIGARAKAIEFSYGASPEKLLGSLISNTRTRLDNVGTMITNIQKQIDYNNNSISAIQTRKTNALDYFTGSDEEKATLAKTYDDSIESVGKQNDSLQQQIPGLLKQQSRYTAFLDTLLNTQTAKLGMPQIPLPDISNDQKKVIREHMDKSKLRYFHETSTDTYWKLDGNNLQQMSAEEFSSKQGA